MAEPDLLKKILQRADRASQIAAQADPSSPEQRLEMLRAAGRIASRHPLRAPELEEAAGRPVPSLVAAALIGRFPDLGAAPDRAALQAYALELGLELPQERSDAFAAALQAQKARLVVDALFSRLLGGAPAGPAPQNELDALHALRQHDFPPFEATLLAALLRGASLRPSP